MALTRESHPKGRILTGFLPKEEKEEASRVSLVNLEEAETFYNWTFTEFISFVYQLGHCQIKRKEHLWRPFHQTVSATHAGVHYISAGEEKR